jgi:DNA-binding MarR family transcriptional regulator
MDYPQIAQDIRKLFKLKALLFGTFDCSSLNHGLNRTEQRVLMMSWHERGASMTYLSREAGLEKGSLTTVIDALERRGLVKRDRDQNDRRSILVVPTQKGITLAGRIELLFYVHLEGTLSRLKEEDRSEFAKAAATFARLMGELS